MNAASAPAPIVGTVRTSNASGSLARWLGGNLSGAIGLTLVAVTVLVSVFAPWLTSYDPESGDLTATLVAPGTGGHVLGTDQLGRDVFARVLYGGRAPLLIVVGGVAIATVFGVGLGLVAGLRGGIVDQVASRLADIQLAIPVVLLAITLLAFAGNGIWNLVLMVAVASWPAQFRVVRAQAAAMRSMPFVEAATMTGGSQFSVVVRHLLPNVLPIVAVTATLAFSAGITIEAGLAFLGLGVPPPAPDWGQMIAAGQTQLNAAWWLSVTPGVALLVLLLGVQLTGDWLSNRFSVQGLVKNGG